MPAAPLMSRYPIRNRVVDSLDLRVSQNRAPSGWLQQQLPAWREHLEDYTPQTPDLVVDLAGLGAFRLQSSKRPYEFVLINPEICDIRIWNPDKWATAIGGGTGQVYISFRSRYMQFGREQGVDRVLEAVELLLFGEQILIGTHNVRNQEFCRVAGMDLAVDLELEGFELKDLKKFVCRARKYEAKTEDALHAETAKAVRWFSQSEAALARGAVNENGRDPHLDNKGGAKYMRKLCETLGLDPETRSGQLKRLIAALAQGWSVSERAAWVHASSDEVETIYFGRFASELFARIYHKECSLDDQGKGYMRQVWAGAGWTGKKPVWRVEFSLSGEFLKNAVIEGITRDLREYGVAMAAIPAIWAYLSTNWLRHTVPDKSEGNKSRWQTSVWWKVVSRAWEAAAPIKRQKAVPKPSEEQLKSQLLGIAASIAAMRWSERYWNLELDPGEIEDPTLPIFSEIIRFLDSSDGQKKVAARRIRYGLEPQTDATYRALLRAERMAEGEGS